MDAQRVPRAEDSTSSFPAAFLIRLSLTMPIFLENSVINVVRGMGSLRRDGKTSANRVTMTATGVGFKPAKDCRLRVTGELSPSRDPKL